jgi:hypothetical protein
MKNISILLTIMAMAGLLQASPTIYEDFQGQTPPSKDAPPAGWIFVKPGSTQANTYYEAVGESGNIVGRVKCDTVLSSYYDPGYLACTRGLDATKPFSGSFDLLLEDEGVWTDGKFLIGDILNGHTVNYYWVKWQLSSPYVELRKSNYTAVPAMLAESTNVVDRLTLNTWYRVNFEWIPSSGTTGTLTVAATKPDGTKVTITSNVVTLPAVSYFGFGSANDAIRVDNIVIDSGLGAYEPSPANNSINQGTLSGDDALVTLSWKAGKDPNTLSNELFNPQIKKHYLYLQRVGVDVDFVLNATVDQISTTDPVINYPVTLSAQQVYRWKVEEALDNGLNGVYPAGEPNNITSAVWTFGTVLKVPVIETNPVDQFVFPNEAAAFSVEATSISPMAYTWYKSTDNANSTPEDDVQVGTTSELTISNVQLTDEGYYYCSILNTGGTSLSQAAQLGVKRKLAHYEFNQATDVAGTYTDALGNYPAAMINPAHARTYITGVDGQANGAIVMDPNSIANAGTWDPSGNSNQLTLSCWVKWNGLRGPGTFQGIVGKSNTYFTGFRWGWRTRDNVVNLDLLSNPTNTQAMIPLVTPDQSDQWQYLCVTVADGQAAAYLDGIQIDTGTFIFGTEVATDGSWSAYTAPVWIGTAEDPTLGRWFDGAIDDLRIYNYALSAEAVVDQYNAIAAIDKVICSDARYGLESDFANSSTGLTIDDAGFVPDCRIDFADLAYFIQKWMDCGLYPQTACN